MVFKEEVS